MLMIVLKPAGFLPLEVTFNVLKKILRNT